MKQIIKKAIAAVVCGSLLLALAACNSDNNNKEVIVVEKEKINNNDNKNIDKDKIIVPYTKVDCEEIILDKANVKVLGYEIYENIKEDKYNEKENIIIINIKVTNTSSNDLIQNDILNRCFQNGVELPLSIYGITQNLLTIPMSLSTMTLRPGATSDKICFQGGVLNNLQDDIEIDFYTKFGEDKKTVKFQLK